MEVKVKEKPTKSKEIVPVVVKREFLNQFSLEEYILKKYDKLIAKYK